MIHKTSNVLNGASKKKRKEKATLSHINIQDSCQSSDWLTICPVMKKLEQCSSHIFHCCFTFSKEEYLPLPQLWLEIDAVELTAHLRLQAKCTPNFLRTRMWKVADTNLVVYWRFRASRAMQHKVSSRPACVSPVSRVGSHQQGVLVFPPSFGSG